MDGFVAPSGLVDEAGCVPISNPTIETTEAPETTAVPTTPAPTEPPRVISTPRPAVKRPNMQPSGGSFVGYTEVKVSSSEGALSVTTNGADPPCDSSSPSSAPIVLIITQSAIVKAVSCESGVPSQVSSEAYVITPGPVVEVTIRLEGSISAADMNDAAKNTFKKSFAKLIKVAPELIKLSVRNARRKLLAVDLKMEILTDSSSSAEKVQQAVQTADLKSIDLPPGAKISDISVLINDPSKPPKTPSTTPAAEPEKKSNVVVIIAAAIGGVVAISLMLALLLFYLRRVRLTKTELKLVSVESEPLPPSLVEPRADDDDADEEAPTTEAPTTAAPTTTEAEEPRTLKWSDLTEALSTMSSDLVSAPYAAPAPMEVTGIDGGLPGGALFKPGHLPSNTASFISLTREELEER